MQSITTFYPTSGDTDIYVVMVNCSLDKVKLIYNSLVREYNQKKSAGDDDEKLLALIMEMQDDILKAMMRK